MISKIQLFLRLSIGALLLTHAFPELQAQTADEYFMLGNNAYASGDFARAKENYMSADKEKSAAEISYNLANTCAKLGDKGEAMLHYMRALYQNPRMREAEANMSVFAKDNSLETPDGIFTLPFFAELSAPCRLLLLPIQPSCPGILPYSSASPLSAVAATSLVSSKHRF